MTSLKFKLITLIFICLLQSCFCSDDSFDKQTAMSTINLSQRDLQNFNSLKLGIIKDLAAIKQITPSSFSSKGIWTNSYYLNQIDSIKYSSILLQLKGKYSVVTHFEISFLTD